MNKIGIIFGIFAILVVLFVFQYFFPKTYSKLPFDSFINFGPIMKDYDGGESNNNQNSNGSSSENPNPSYQGPRPETSIVFGPEEGEVIKDNIEVVFKFRGSWSGDNTDLVFETKLSGVDESWIEVYENERRIELLSGDHTYSFQVRAKTSEGIVDLTPASRSFRGLFSSNFQKVNISSISPDNFPSIMSLSLSNNSEEDINVRDWKIKGRYGAMSIPQAVDLYDQFSRTNQDISLVSGGVIHIFGENSPIGANFRLNKCIGYLNNTYNFSQDLPSNCPYPSDELGSLNSACRDYLSSLGYCQIPDPTILNSFSGDSTCRSFADSHFNYSSCVRNYRNDKDFFSSEWYVFSGRGFVGRDHDRLELYDQKGLLVSFVEY